jgi:hypothetical protein
MYEQPELVFHDTVPLKEEDLPKARETALKQKEWVLDFFRQRFSMSFTPTDVYEAALGSGPFMLLTSIRRSITDLTKEGKLIKCDWSESRQGSYGKLNRVWTYNRNFVNPINPTPLTRTEYEKSMEHCAEQYKENIRLAQGAEPGTRIPIGKKKDTASWKEHFKKYSLDKLKYLPEFIARKF